MEPWGRRNLYRGSNLLVLLAVVMVISYGSLAEEGNE